MTELPSPTIDVKPGEAKAKPKGFARLLGLFDTAAKAITTVTALIVAIGGAWIAIENFGSDGAAKPDTNQTASSVTAADQVEKCEHAHGMTSDHQRLLRSPNSYEYASCEWPSPGYADTDGFSAVVVSTDNPGPGTFEATDATLLDTFTQNNCSTYSVTYEFGLQGDNEHPVAATVPAGTVTGSDDPGNAYHGVGADTVAPPGDRWEFDYIHSSDEELADVRCTG